MLKKNSTMLSVRDYSFSLLDSRGKEIPVSGENSYTEGTVPPLENSFIRVFGGDRVTFRVHFKNIDSPKKVFLHSDLGGELWEFLPLAGQDEMAYTVEIDLPVGGYFSFRLAVLTRKDELAWEPWLYHRLMIDPETLRCVKLYTLLPTVSGTIRDWTKDLSRIRDLGFNAVHILPFTAMGPSESPYSADDLFTIDSFYLQGRGDFEALVKKALELKIALCFDIVLNHISTSSLMARTKAHWIQPDSTREDGFKRAGCWHQNSWISWEDLALINYDHPDPQIRREIFLYMKKYLMYWAETAVKTGGFIRLDNLHSSHRGFIHWVLGEMRRESPGLAVLSEFFGAHETLRQGVGIWGLNLLMANTWEYAFAPQLQEYLSQVHSSSSSIRYLLEPTSHDTGAAAELFGTGISSIPRYFCCALMGTGQTGIVQGFESGVPRKIDFIGRKGLVPLEGTLDLSDFLQKVNLLMDTFPVFLEYGNTRFLETGSDSLIVCVRRDSRSGETFLLASNFDIHNRRDFFYSLSGPAEPLLLERTDFSGPENSGQLALYLAPCGVCVFRI